MIDLAQKVKIDRYQKIFRKTMNRKIPFTVHWELTNKCNLKCVHCYIVPEPKKKELNFKKMKSILDQLSRQGCLYLVFSGGEIFTRQDFFDIAGYARKKGFALRLLTNGTLINVKAANQIKKISPLSVEMSLYGTSPGIHEAITQTKGSFAQTIQAFKLLKERGIKTVVKSSLMRENLGEFAGLQKLAQKLGANFVYDPTIVARNDRSKDVLRYKLQEGDLKDFFSAQVKLSKREPVEMPDNSRICNAGLNILSISAYGQAYPCVAIRKECGDLSRESFAVVWRSAALSKIRAIRFSDLWKCKGCGLLSYCDRCPGLADLEDDDILGPSTAACQLAKVRQGILEESKNE
jgi:radical SAM protein with 4Fe4S-binding SPASM domain